MKENIQINTMKEKKRNFAESQQSILPDLMNVKSEIRNYFIKKQCNGHANIMTQFGE